MRKFWSKGLLTACLIVLCAGTLGAEVNVGDKALSKSEWLGLSFQAHQVATPVAELARLWSNPYLNQVGRNAFNHQRQFMPAGTDACCPNQDTLYSLAWLDASQSPLVLEIPPLGGRYFVMQTTDIFTRNRTSFSRENVPSTGGKILITGLGWQGTVPENMSHLDLGTNDGLILLRIAPRSMSDIPAVRELQDKLVLRPLDPSAAQDHSFPPFQAADPYNALKMLDFAVKRNPLGGRDGGIFNTLSALGIGTNEGFAPERLPESVQTEIQRGIQASEALLERHIPNVGDRSGQWLYLPGGETFTSDIFSRATVAVSYILPNDENVAIYLIANTDTHGDQLNGSRSYTMTFEGPPPAKEFWSMIAYSWPDVRLQTNPYGVYSIGDRTPNLELNDDGGVTLHFSSTKPNQVAEANWLPLPEGDVGLVMRLYAPFQSVLNRQWQAPDLKPIEE